MRFAGSMPPLDKELAFCRAWQPIDAIIATLVLSTFAALVLIRSHYFGFLSDDSNAYLALAQNLVSGRGWHMPSLAQPDQLFAIWPVGYPTMIAGVAMLGGTPVFDASKILNIVLAGANLAIFKYIFDRDFPWFAWLLLLPPLVEVSCFTWSEVPFTTGLLWLSVAVARFWDGSSPPWRGALGMTLASSMLFLSRYIGAFSVGIVAAVAVAALLRGDRRRFLAAGTATVIITAGIAAYLYNNLGSTGYATGMQRLPAPESATWLVWMTMKAYLAQIDVLLAQVDLATTAGRISALSTTIVIACLTFYVCRNASGRGNTPIERTEKQRTLTTTLVAVGLTYVIAITAMRWTSQFDNLSVRLLFPGTLLVLLGLICSWRQASVANRLRRAVPIGIAFGLTAQVLGDMNQWRNHPSPATYGQQVATVLASAASIPEGSIVAFGEPQLAYLRPDLLQVTPKFRPLHGEMQSWNDFMSEISIHAEKRQAFVFVQLRLDPAQFHPTVIEYMRTRRGERLAKFWPRQQ